MSTIAESLTALQNAKTAIAGAITEKGGTVAAGDGFADFAAAILEISTGSGGELPTLTKPAAANDILSGREAISENGTAITGTLRIRCGTVTLENDLTNMTMLKITHDLGSVPKLIFIRKTTTEKVASAVSWGLYYGSMGGYSSSGSCFAVTGSDLSQTVEHTTGNRVAIAPTSSSFNLGMTDNNYFWKAGDTVEWWVIA